MLEAASNGIELLPFIFGTPDWVAKDIDGYNCSGIEVLHLRAEDGRRARGLETFVGEVVDRYGPGRRLLDRAPGGAEEPDRG